jgi:hypothetical protein
MHNKISDVDEHTVDSVKKVSYDFHINNNKIIVIITNIKLTI